jgi:hypothetical protein
MSQVKTDAGRLKLHVDSHGRICAAVGDTMPRIYAGLDDVWSTLGRFPDIYLLAAPSNASLIHQLYGLQQQQGGNVWLASPALIKDDPVAASAVLKFRRLTDLPASLGGWHPMTDADAVIYDLGQLQRTQATIDESIARLMQHPAWPLWSFMAHLDLAAFARLLTLIGDPRWYVDPKHPTRDSRLQLFLGLTPHKASRPQSAGRAGRLAVVLDAWTYADPLPAEDSPRYFVYRRYRERQEEPVMARIRASQHFLRFIHHTWLASQSRHSREMLAPDCIFWQADEIDAFTAHVQSW